MNRRILVIDDDPGLGAIVAEALPEYPVTVTATGAEGLKRFAAEPFELVLCELALPDMGGLEVVQHIRAQQPRTRVIVAGDQGRPEHLLATLRENVVDFLIKPFTHEQVRSAVTNVLACEQAIEVVSVTPKWIQLRVPASFQVAASLEDFFTNLHADIDEVTRRTVGLVFRELLNNAIEHGCQGDEKRRIGLGYVRMQRAILYRIQDPGGGFDRTDLPHAAVGNPPQEPIRHLEVRQERGLRPGGYGLLWIENLADELIFNERRNEVLFVKYLDAPPAAAG